MVEYGLMLALITAVCAAIIVSLGSNVQAKFSAASDCFVTPGAGNCP